MIQVEHLSKSYGSVQALDDVGFTVGPGEIIGLLGPNGAGKTTLMQVITGFLLPDSGTVRVDGRNVALEPRAVQELIGYLPENAPLYSELTVQGHLSLACDLRGITGRQRVQQISEAVYHTGLEDRLTQPVGELSKGFRQRVGLAQAILHRPKLLILDEPTNGLDPTQIQEVRRLIRSLAGHSTVVLSTHILSEVEATCGRAVIIMNGRIRADARLPELAATPSAVVSFEGPPAGAETKLRGIPGVRSVEGLDGTAGRGSFRVSASAGTDLCPKIYELVRENDWPLLELKNELRTLESVFNELALAEGGVTV